VFDGVFAAVFRPVPYRFFMQSSPNPHPIDISYKVFIKFFIAISVIVSLYFLRNIVAALLFAVVIASGIEPAILWLRRYRIPRTLAVIMIYALMVCIVSGVLYMIVPTVIEEADGFFSKFSAFRAENFQNVPFSQILEIIQKNGTGVFSGGLGQFGALTGNIFQIISTVFGSVVSGVILVVVSFYLAAQERGIENFLRVVTPLEYEEYMIDLWSRSQAKMGQWLRAQLLLAVLVGLLVYFSLIILGFATGQHIQYAFLLGLLAAVFEVIPVIGPILAAVPAVLTAFLIDPYLGLITVLIYIAVQQIESQVIVPVVMGRSVGLNPIVVVLALLVGANLGGILGIFLAVPLASVFLEFIVDIDKKKRGAFQYLPPPA